MAPVASQIATLNTVLRISTQKPNKPLSLGNFLPLKSPLPEYRTTYAGPKHSGILPTDAVGRFVGDCMSEAERRKSRRFPIKHPAVVRYAGGHSQEISAVTKNASVTGVLLFPESD